MSSWLPRAEAWSSQIREGVSNMVTTPLNARPHKGKCRGAEAVPAPVPPMATRGAREVNLYRW